MNVIEQVGSMASLLIDGEQHSPKRWLYPAAALPARLRCYLGVSILMLADRLLKLALGSLHFPSALVGMALIISALVVARRWRPGADAAAQHFFQPSVEWVAHKWLPCFYSPALTTLPLAALALPASSVAAAAAVVAFGVVLTAAFTSHVAMAIRRVVGTQLEPVLPQAHPVTFSPANYITWGGAAVISLAALLLGPAAAHAHAASAFLLSSTLLGFMAGMALPKGVKRVAHPIVACAAAANAAAALLGALTGRGYWAALRGYLTHGASGVYGAGDVLFAFLGVIILCFGFKVFEQWEVLCRHAPEVLGATSAAAAFTMLSTATLARAAALPRELSRSLVARGATLALALPIGERLGAPPQFTAAAVQLTGIIGGTAVLPLLTAMGFTDAIARGLTAAATAHGLGTAAVAAGEPESVPFAALAYALCGVSASLLAALPPFAALLLVITG